MVNVLFMAVSPYYVEPKPSACRLRQTSGGWHPGNGTLTPRKLRYGEGKSTLNNVIATAEIGAIQGLPLPIGLPSLVVAVGFALIAGVLIGLYAAE